MRTQDLGERLSLGLAQLRELLGDVRNRTVMLTQLDAVQWPTHLGGGGRVTRVGQCARHTVDSGFNAVGRLGYSRQAAPRDGTDRAFAADLGLLTLGGGRRSS